MNYDSNSTRWLGVAACVGFACGGTSGGSPAAESSSDEASSDPTDADSSGPASSGSASTSSAETSSSDDGSSSDDDSTGGTGDELEFPHCPAPCPSGIDLVGDACEFVDERVCRSADAEIVCTTRGFDLDDAPPPLGPHCPDPACLDDAAIVEQECFDQTFVELDDALLGPYRERYEQLRGRPLTAEALPPNSLGFFIDPSGVFVSALHTLPSECFDIIGVPATEWLVGRDGSEPPTCNSIEFLYIGPDASRFPDSAGCFDCVPPEGLGDIYVGRRMDVRGPVPYFDLADALPSTESEMVLVGQPFVEHTPNAIRASLGTFKEPVGRAVVVSNFAMNGFSGGPMLDAQGRAFAVTTTRVPHLFCSPREHWQPQWTLGVSLLPYAEQIACALAHARGEPTSTACAELPPVGDACPNGATAGECCTE